MAREEDIEILYDAVADSTRWDALLQRWLVRLDADRIVLFSYGDVDPAVRLNQHVGHDPEYLRKYWENFAATDPWTLAAERQGVARTGRTTIDEELVPTQELVRTPIFNECLRPEGIAYRAGAIISDGRDPALSALRLTVHRNARRPQFDIGVHRELAWIAGQIRRAARLRETMLRSDAERGALTAVLDAVPSGAVVVAEDGTIVYANRQGESLLRLCNGIRPARRLRLAGAAEASQLSRMIAGAAGLGGAGLPVGGTLHIARPDGAPPLIATVSPLPGGIGFAGVAKRLALVLLVDPTPQSLNLEDRLRALYRFSPTEIRAVLPLAEGATRAEIADRLGVSIETVATHVKRAMAKAGAMRQQELLSLVTALKLSLPMSPADQRGRAK